MNEDYDNGRTVQDEKYARLYVGKLGTHVDKGYCSQFTEDEMTEAGVPETSGENQNRNY